MPLDLKTYYVTTPLLLAAALLHIACTVPTADPDVKFSQHAATVCADGPTLHGVDVSSWQGDALDWEAIAAGGDADFVFIRASHGLVGDGFNDGPDAHFDLNWAEAGRVELPRGAYQYFISTEDPIEQANFLIEKIGPLRTGDLPPVIDVEFRAVDPLASVPEIITGLGLWLAHVEAELGVKPIIYTSQTMWTQMTENTSMFADYPLWTAHYGTECPLTPGGWNTWTFHQYSSSGGIVGYNANIDKNRFMGSIEDLQAMASHEDPAPEPDAGAEPPLFGADAGVEPVGEVASSCSSSGGGAGAITALLLLAMVSWLRNSRKLRVHR